MSEKDEWIIVYTANAVVSVERVGCVSAGCLPEAVVIVSDYQLKFESRNSSYR